MRYVTLEEVYALHRMLIEQSGGSTGIRDANLLDSAVAQPQMTFDGQDLHSTVTEKAAALGYSLVMNHPFVDGNKRVGHAAMEVFLVLNGHEIGATVDEGEQIILSLAAGNLSKEDLLNWLNSRVKPLHR